MANAIGLAAHLIAARDGDAVMGVFPADHFIGMEDEFAAIVSHAVVAPEPDGESVEVAVAPVPVTAPPAIDLKIRPCVPAIFSVPALPQQQCWSF